MAVSLTGVYWELEGIITATVIGAGANSTLRGMGKANSAAFALAAAPYGNQIVAWGGQAASGTVASLDLTLPYYISVSYVSSSASNSCSLNELEVYGLN